MMLSFGVRLAIVLPTLFFLLSQLLRSILKSKTKRMIGGDNIQSVAGPISFGSMSHFLGEQSTREFRFEFFIDSTILSIANGLILAFELSRVEYGVVMLIFGVTLSMAGFVAAETDSNGAISFLVFVSILFFVAELSYFSAFGTVTNVLGFTLLPWHLFILPPIVITLFVFIIAIATALKKPAVNPK